MGDASGDSVDFPIICESCLGDNPYLRMTKQEFGKECKICMRPFTVFRWMPGKGLRYRTTQICTTCAKLKNVCQGCILDLEFGLPIQVRDTALGLKDSVARGHINNTFQVKMAEEEMGRNGDDAGGKSVAPGRDFLKQMAGTNPYFKRNKSDQVCQYFLRGKCWQGDKCPLRHDRQIERTHDKAKAQAKKLKAAMDATSTNQMSAIANATVSLQEESNIKTLFVMGVIEEIVEDDLKEVFGEFGDLKSIVLSRKNKCAFINYNSREVAQLAFEKTSNGCMIKDSPIQVQWARPKAEPKSSESSSSSAAKSSEKGKAPMKKSAIPLPPGAAPITYQSQLPSQMGSSRDRD